MIKKVFKKIIKRNATFSVLPFDHFDVLNQHQNQNLNQYHQNQNQNQQLRIENRNSTSISPFQETKKNIFSSSKSGTVTGTRAASVSGSRLINHGEDGKKKDFDLNSITLDDYLEHQFKDLHVAVNHRGKVHQIESLNFIDSINKENLAEEIFFAQHRPLGTSTAAPIGEPSKTVILDIHQDWNSYSLNTHPSQSHQLPQLDQAILPSHSSTQAPLFLINILKRRRKKMNKHKWKKYRREVRNSTRYNPERSRKKKKMKKRGLVL